MHAVLAYALPLLLTAPAAPPDDAPKQVAIAYLKALDGSGKQSARELLLGGLTLTAEEVSVPNWKIQDRLVQREEDDVKGAVELMKALDKSGAKALTNIMNLAESDGDDIGMATVSQEQANKLMAPTQIAAKRFKERYPVFSYCARAGKEVYWHPANPWREVVKKLGTSGKYVLEFHRFNVLETSGGTSRVWPLRVLRIKTESYDSGWKILPASDWDPDW